MEYKHWLTGLDTYPAGKVSDSAVATFFRFLAHYQAPLQELAPIDVHFALKKGHAFEWFQESRWSEPVFQRIYQDYFQTKLPLSASFSVASVLALFLMIGVRVADFNEDINDSTYDFRVGWTRRVIYVKTVSLQNMGAGLDVPVAGISAGRDGLRPCLVLAIDVGNLPNAFPLVAEMLEALLPQWTHISGVLAFSDYYKRDNMGWTCRFFNNPAANPSLDPYNLTYLRRFEKTLVLAKKLTDD